MDEEGSSQLTVRVAEAAWRGPIDEVEEHCRRAVEATLTIAGVPPWLKAAGVDILLTADSEVARLNADWRGQAAATDVLSFPERALDPGALPPSPPSPSPLGSRLGDIVVAFETATREAQAEGKTAADHLAHLVVHGTLHLLGHDHAGDEEAARMEALERAALADLGIVDPYAARELLG